MRTKQTGHCRVGGKIIFQESFLQLGYVQPPSAGRRYSHCLIQLEARLADSR